MNPEETKKNELLRDQLGVTTPVVNNVVKKLTLESTLLGNPVG
jgi:hypothetical protein